MAQDTPKHYRNLALYEIYVRNHGPNGTFADVEADLSRIQAMGVDVAWFMPIHPKCRGIRGEGRRASARWRLRRPAERYTGGSVCGADAVARKRFDRALRARDREPVVLLGSAGLASRSKMS